MKSERLYRIACLIRQVELKIVEVYDQDIMQTPVHLSIGQEAIASAVCAHLNNDDLVLGTHRSHALYLAKGGSPTELFAELLGRVNGCSGGYGGSMHLIDVKHGLLGTSALVGGNLPIAVGMAMGIERPRIAAVIFGDGACDEGVFYESLNFARLKRVPLIFVCENNRYSVYTHIKKRRCVTGRAIAKASQIKTIYVPIEVANDAVAFYCLLDKPLRAIRKGDGPLFVECETVRAADHHGIEDDIKKGFRPESEGDLAKKYDPLLLMKKYLKDDIAERIQREVKEEVERAFTAALRSKPLKIKVNYGQLGDSTKTA